MPVDLKKFHFDNWVMKPQVPEALYTNRDSQLKFIYEEALRAKTDRAMSTVLLGQRRMGKTEIFIRVVNRLFWEQDHTDPKAVIPVFYQFLERPISVKSFAIEYVENFLRWWAAFRLRNPDIVEQEFRIKQLKDLIEQKLVVPPKVKGIFNILEGLQKDEYVTPEQVALMLPRTFAERERGKVAMFLDEFQNVHLPQYDFYLVGNFQPAVESLDCPHFVTGSAMSMLARDILGKGALFGRFQSELIEPLTPYYGTILAHKSARHYQSELPETMAPMVGERCGGNPFYINAVIRQAAKQEKTIQDEEVLDEILKVDLSSGFIWSELHDQVTRWINRINELDGAGLPVTKWVLYLSALEEDEKIDLTRIQRELKEREGKEVSLETIRDILIKLSRGDLIEYLQLGNWFRKIDDPILLEFLKVWGRIEVEGQKRQKVKESLEHMEEGPLKRRIHDHMGYLAEVYMTQVLWNSQNQTLPGRFFHQDKEIKMPSEFFYVNQRQHLKTGKNREIDLVAAGTGKQKWVGESKWWNGRKVNKSEVEILVEKGKRLKEEEERPKMALRYWFFAHDGFTPEAEDFMKENEVFWSNRKDLDELLNYLGLRTLPDL